MKRFLFEICFLVDENMAGMSGVWPCVSAVMRKLLGGGGGHFYDTVKRDAMHGAGSHCYIYNQMFGN